MYPSARNIITAPDSTIHGKRSRTKISLRTDGRYIVDANGNRIHLHFFQKHGFEDQPEGKWKNLTGSYRNLFDETAVRANLKALKQWGANGIRVIDRTLWWINNTAGDSGKPHRDVIKRLVEMCQEEGIYVSYCLFSLEEASGHHGIPWGTPLIPTRQDFVNLWIEIATELMQYPNVMFELWNEVTENQDEWFTGCQEVIAAIRAVSDNIIIIQWDWDVWYIEVDNDNVFGNTLDWVNDPRIQASNILYSTHIYFDGRGLYRAAVDLSETGFKTREDILRAFTAEKVIACVEEWNKPLFIGEIGLARAEEEPSRADNLLSTTNALKILNEYAINYSLMWWWVGSDIDRFGVCLLDPVTKAMLWNDPTDWGLAAQEILSAAPSSPPPTPFSTSQISAEGIMIIGLILSSLGEN